MRRTALLVVAASLALVAAGARSADAITFGQFDNNLHPNTGALLGEFEGELGLICTGTLIAPRVFLTAAHCTDFLRSVGQTGAWVTFDPTFDSASPVIHGTYVQHERFGVKGGGSDPYDIAVVLLDQAASPTPARLPAAGLLDSMQASGALRSATFTAVGYGTVREVKTGGPHALFFDGIRRYALQSSLSLQKPWFTLSMQPSTGNGGTCFGDSGGPHFLGGTSSNLLVSLTVTGDAMCRATDKTYRLDTPAAREFLSRFRSQGVVLP
jgi:secreted trypsin-like serine protease